MYYQFVMIYSLFEIKNSEIIEEVSSLQNKLYLIQKTKNYFKYFSRHNNNKWQYHFNNITSNNLLLMKITLNFY